MERGIGIYSLISEWTMDDFWCPFGHLSIFCPYGHFVHCTVCPWTIVHGQKCNGQCNGQLSMDKNAMDSAMDNCPWTKNAMDSAMDSCPWTKMQWTVQWTFVHGRNGQWTMDMDKKHAMDAQLCLSYKNEKDTFLLCLFYIPTCSVN